jgi:tetratricopeptide (TPR) repeat protein
MIRQARFQTDLSYKPEKIASYMAALDMIFHISSFAKVLIASEPLEIIGSENDRSALVELKCVVSSMINGSSSEVVRLQQFFNKLSVCSFSEFSKCESVDILTAWDDIVKLIMIVIPPLREVFLGHLESAQEVPGWLNLSSRCFRAAFSSVSHSLEDSMRACCNSYQKQLTSNTNLNKRAESVVTSNVMILRRSPEILVVAIESALLKQNINMIESDLIPSVISFPDSFDLTSICPIDISYGSSDDLLEDENSSRFYDLTSVAVLEGQSFTSMQGFFRLQNAEGLGQDRWYKGAGGRIEEVAKSRIIEGNYYSSSQSIDKRVHPRILVYMRRDLPQMLERTAVLVSKGGQMRALGDVAFALAMTTTDNYSEARRCYEEAIALDESLKDVLQDNLMSLDKLEGTQRAKSLEEQGDLALANGRYREASDQYTKSLMASTSGSPECSRVKEKMELLSKIIALETSCHFAEKGEDSLKSGNFSNAKDYYLQTQKLNPDLHSIQFLLQGIEKTIQQQMIRQKTHEANQAMKAFKYRQAHQLLLEAIAIAPEEKASFQSVLDDLGPLIQVSLVLV